jgi:hypothetical protein
VTSLARLALLTSACWVLAVGGPAVVPSHAAEAAPPAATQAADSPPRASEPLVESSQPESVELRVGRLEDEGAVELVLLAADTGEFLIEASSDLVQWTPVAAARLAGTARSARAVLQCEEPQVFFRARLAGDATPDPSLPRFEVASGNPSETAEASAAPAMSFRYSVTGTATESWTESVPEQRAYQQLNAGQSQEQDLFTAVRDESVVVTVEAKVPGTTASLQVWELGSFGEQSLVASPSAIVPDWEWAGRDAANVRLQAFKRYRWRLTVSNPGKTLGYGTAQITGYRQIPRSVTVNGTPFSKDATITRAESPKDVGGFTVRFTPTHGGTISGKSFRVSSSNPDVAVKFSDTASVTTASETAHVIATTSKGCGDCNWNGLDDCQEIAAGVATDCNTNGIPDECEAGDLTVIYVDFRNAGCQNGTEAFPFKAVAKAYTAATDGDTIRVKSGNYPEALTMSRPLRLEAIGGPVTIGR